MNLPSPFSQLLKKLVGSNNAVVAEPDNLEDALVEATQSTDLRMVLNTISEKHPLILVHGRAGTGKTTLIKQIKNSGLRVAVVAPTGIAALNAEGMTVHSFFRLPPGVHDLDSIEPNGRLQSVLKRLDLLIIDEVSMVRADLLDAIDKSMHLNLSSQKPFGGIQVLLAGDFLQLPPITKEEEVEVLHQRGYETFYAFGAHSLRSMTPRVVELRTVYRQTEADFLALLGDLRLGQNVEHIVSRLNESCHREHRDSAQPLILTSTKPGAEQYNRKGLASLPGTIFEFKGIVKDKFAPKDFPAPEHLQLKVNARVMMVKNDPEKRWVNGSLATVIRLSNEKVWVRVDRDDRDHQVDAVTWETHAYRPDPASSKLKQVTIGTYSQLPIQPAWAINIHKCQGLTLDDVRVDLGYGAFANGQTYVALSRVRTMQGLSFTRALNISDVKVDGNLVDGVQGMLQFQ